MAQPQSLNVLAIDGGGVRGLSSLLILRRVMEKLQLEVKLKSALLPCQIFHVICGTSTGGLIAIMLGRLRMSVDDAIEHYRVLCKAVFGSPKLFRGLRSAIGLPMYKASILEKCIKSITAKSDATGHNQDASLNDPLAGNQDEGHCHTFVVAISQARADAPAQLFRSYKIGTTSSVDACTIWQSARATTATSKFFRPIKVGMPPITYLDGNLVANNPSEIACQEVRRLYGDRPIDCFLSLGTGVPDIVGLEGHILEIARACEKLATDCDKAADELGEKFRSQSEEKGLPDPFFRFSVNRGLEDIDLDEWARESELAGVTDAYLRFYPQQVDLQRCVKVLKAQAIRISESNDLR